MNTLTELFSSSVAQRIGWALVHFLWQGAAVGLLLALVLQLLHRRSPQARYVAACCALGLLAVLPVVTAILTTPLAAVSPGAAEAPVPVRPAPSPLLPDDGAFSPEVVQLPTAAGQWHPAAPARVADTVTDTYTASAKPAPPEPAAKAAWLDKLRAWVLPVLPWGVLAWLAGVVGLSLWHLSGWLVLQRIRRLATPSAQAALVEAFGRLAQRLAVSRPVRLLESALVKAPLVIGWLRPAVLLPAGALCGLSPAQVEAILAHELAHIRRWDCLVRMLQAAVETLLFYHPAVWWVSARIRQESEDCCDELAVDLCGDRRGYATALAIIAGASAPARHGGASRSRAASLTPAASGGKLLPRLRRIMGLTAPTASATARSAVAVLVVVGTLAIAIGLHLWGCGNDTTRTTTQLATRAVTQQKEPGEQWVEGRVIDRLGRPVQGAMVSLLLADFHEVKTDSEGGFRYPLPSEYLEGGALKRRTYAFVSCPQRNLAGVAEIDGLHDAVTVRLQPAITLRGRVLGPGGKTVPGARIGMQVLDPAPEKFPWAGGFQHEEPRFDADGNFQIIGLPPGCRYTLSTGAPGFGQASQEVDTRAARDGVLEIPPTVLRAANLAVSGIVIGPDDRPVGGARVSVGPEGSQPSRQAVADPQGRFKIDGVCSGRLTLRAEPKDQSMHGVVMAEAGEDDVRLYLVSSRGACVLPSPDKPVTLVGRPLPDLSDVGLDASATRGKPLLICFWNSTQTESQQALCDLSARRPQLAAKGVSALGVLAFARNQQHLRYWLDKQAVDMPMGVVRHKSLTDYVGMVRCLERWGVRSLPWLIIANEAGIVQAEGFQIDDLDQAVALVRPDRPRHESPTQPATQPPASTGPREVGQEFLAAVAAGQDEKAKGLTTPDTVKGEGFPKLRESYDLSGIRLAQVLVGKEQACILTTRVSAKAGGGAIIIGLKLTRNGDRWLVRDLDALPTEQAVEKYVAAFMKVEPGATTQPATLAAAEESAADRLVRQRLAQVLPKVQFSGIGLGDVIEFLREVGKVNVYVNWAALKNAGIDKETQVNVKLADVTIERTLRAVLEDVAGANNPPGFALDEGVVRISTKDGLARMRRISALPLRAAPDPPADREVRKRLAQTLPKVEFSGIGFGDVVQFLRDVSGCNIQVNWRALKLADIDEKTPVNVKLADVTIEKALRTVLEDVGGANNPPGYVVDEGVISISTAEDLSRRPPAAGQDPRNTATHPAGPSKAGS